MVICFAYWNKITLIATTLASIPSLTFQPLGIYHISLPVMLHAHAKILQCSCLREDFKNVQMQMLRP